MITARAAIPATLLVAVALAMAADLAAQEDAEADLNPFAGFETHYLANGVKVWRFIPPESLW